MEDTAALPTLYGSGPTRRRRALALALTIVAHVLLLLLFLTLAPRHFAEMRPNGTLSVFKVSPDPVVEQSRARSAQAASAPQAARAERAVPPPARTVPPPKVALPTPLRMPEGFIELSHGDMASIDTAMTTARPAQPGAGSGAGTGGGDDTPSSIGPRGERLYAAEWYRRPTRAEMDTYLPRHVMPPVSGVIACRTVARFHVDDCYEIGDSQPGAGISRAMRQAAFQFLVRPPRVGGRSMVGEWVTIKYTILPAAKEDVEGGD